MLLQNKYLTMVSLSAFDGKLIPNLRGLDKMLSLLHRN